MIENYISEQAGFNYQKVLDQYLLTTQVPNLSITFNKDHSAVSYRWTNCIPGFNLPLVLKNGDKKKKIFPAQQLKSIKLKKGESLLFDPAAIIKMYYITVNK